MGTGPYYWVNGVAGNKDNVQDDVKILEDQLKSLSPCFKIHYKHVSSKQHKLRINLNCHGDAVSLENYKDWVSVIVKANSTAFNGTLGLMGEYPHGKMVGRDGKSTFDEGEETDAFGLEWQVLKNEPMLFHTAVGAVQHPQECVMPSLDASAGRQLRRRLGQSLITREAAEMACGHTEDKFDCTYDVLASNDLDMAGAY